jgi:hypothetical protein
MEEINRRFGPGISSHRLLTLCQVASRARQRSIVVRIGATLSPGNDMFEMKAISAHSLRSMTVFASLPCAFFHPYA